MLCTYIYIYVEDNNVYGDDKADPINDDSNSNPRDSSENNESMHA